MDTLGPAAAVKPSSLSRQSRPMTNLKRLLGNWGPVVLLTLGSLWLIQGALARTASHGVFVQGTDYDAGTVKAGAVVIHNFRIVNLSAQPVTVDAQPGCGCTVVGIPDGPLMPLHSEFIRTKIDTDGMTVGNQKRGVMLNLRAGKSCWTLTSVINFKLH